MQIHTLDLEFLESAHTIASFLIETKAGPVLIETGPYSTFPTLQLKIEEKGYQVSDIQHVFLSHIHFDHAGAAWAFAEHGADIYVHPFGGKHLVSPERLVESARRIYKDQMDSLWGRMEPIEAVRVHSIADEEVIQVGELAFKSLHTPGHAVHHIAWQVGDTLFTGDVAGVRIDRGIIVPPCPPPDIHIEDWQNSIDRIRNLDISDMYLTHFGAVSDIERHLDELEARLSAWAEWMKPHFEAGKQVQEVVPDFTAYVRKELMASGLDEGAALQYEKANPAYMSVAGLMRYWKRKLKDKPA